MITKGTQELNAYVRANTPKSAAPDDMRAWYRALVSATPVPEDAKLEPSSCPVSAHWIRPEGVRQDRVILYVHGGAYILGSTETHLELTYRLAKAAKIQVHSVNYRLLPEHAYPACIDDVVAAYQYLVSAGFSPQHIAIAGDSAGGGITLTSAMRIRDAGLPAPGCLLCFSPWTDFTASGESVQTNAQWDSMVDARLLPVLSQMVLNDRDPVAHSPLFANLAHLPPLFVQCGTGEVLYDDSRRLVENYRKAGNSVTYDPWEGMTHVFEAFPTYVPEAIEAVERAGAFLREKLG